MTSLRDAAQQALEALCCVRDMVAHPDNLEFIDKHTTALKAALAEPPYHQYPLLADRMRIDPVTGDVSIGTAPPRCPNCASLEEQNTELDRKLADIEQTSLELCEACGWRTVIPGEGCLNCARSKQAEPVAWRWGYRSITTGEMDWRGYVEIPSHPNLRSPEIIMEPLYTAPPQRKPRHISYVCPQCHWSLDERKPLTDEELSKIIDAVIGFNSCWGPEEKFARAIERAHGIGDK